MNAAKHRALPPRERALATVKRMRQLGLNPMSEGRRELTDEELI